MGFAMRLAKRRDPKVGSTLPQLRVDVVQRMRLGRHNS